MKTEYTNEIRWLIKHYYRKNWLGKRVYSHWTYMLQQKTITNNTVSWVEIPNEVIEKNLK